MNVKLLRKVAKHISEEPRRFIMGDGIQVGDEIVDTIVSVTPTLKVTLHPPCGTAACIAGWSCLLSGKKPEQFLQDDGECDFFSHKGVGTLAQKALGITHQQAETLFHLRNWPKHFRNAFIDAKTPKGRAGAAVRNIEHFIKTKGKE